MILTLRGHVNLLCVVNKTIVNDITLSKMQHRSHQLIWKRTVPLLCHCTEYKSKCCSVCTVYLTTSIKDCGTCAAACCKALGYVVVRGRVHLVTGLTRGREEVSAPVSLDERSDCALWHTSTGWRGGTRQDRCSSWGKGSTRHNRHNEM